MVAHFASAEGTEFGLCSLTITLHGPASAGSCAFSRAFGDVRRCRLSPCDVQCGHLPINNSCLNALWVQMS